MMIFLMAAMLMASVRTPDRTMQLRRFDVGDYACSVRVIEHQSKTGEQREAADLQCDGKTVLHYDFGDGDVVNLSLSIHTPTRIALSWERGSVAGLTVFAMTSTARGVQAKVVFEHSSACGAESFDDGDVLLVHVGRRFSNDSILPAGTNVYRWKDDAYVFERGFVWKEGAKWDDRYCVLFRTDACPADGVTKPVLDEYEAGKVKANAAISPPRTMRFGRDDRFVVSGGEQATTKEEADPYGMTTSKNDGTSRMMS